MTIPLVVPPIILPSHERAATMSSHKYFPDVIVCVSERQEGKYREHHPTLEIATHPNELDGDIAGKRQWIIERWPTVMMIDDDTTGMWRNYLHPRDKMKTKRLTKFEARDAINATATVCAQMGLYLFGFLSSLDPRIYFPQTPFRLKGFVNAIGMGILEGGKLRFDQRAVTKEDYYVSLLNAHMHRCIFADERFSIRQNAAFTNVGGYATMRTAETERKSIEFLEEQFGTDVVRRKQFTEKWGEKRRMSSPYMCELHIPW